MSFRVLALGMLATFGVWVRGSHCKHELVAKDFHVHFC